MSQQFYLMRGGEITDVEEHVKNTGKPSIATSMSRQTTPPEKNDRKKDKLATAAAPTGTGEFDFIAEAKNLYVRKVVGAEVVASCIICKLRAIFVRNYEHYPKTFTDIELLNYMDKILFDMLKELITGVVKYGKDAVPISMVKESIDNAVDAVEVQADRSKMYELIEEVYNAF